MVIYDFIGITPSLSLLQIGRALSYDFVVNAGIFQFLTGMIALIVADKVLWM